MTDEEVALFLAGFSGSLVFSFLRPSKRWWAGALNILCGTLASVFIAPAVCEWQGWVSIHARHAAAFAIGLTGMSVARQVLTSVEADAAVAILRAIKSFFGVKDAGPPDVKK